MQSHSEQKKQTSSAWYRKGDFYTIQAPDNKWMHIDADSYQSCIQEVEFRHTAYVSFLRKIGIYYFSDSTLIIKFFPTYFTGDKLNTLFYNVFPELKPDIEEGFEFALPYPKIVINQLTSSETLKKIERFFMEINKAHSTTEFDDTLLQELRQIMLSPLEKNQHILHTFQSPYTNHSQLKQYYGDSSKKTFSMEHFEFLLSQGEDPNACLLYAVDNIKVLERLLQYGANPFFPRDWFICFASAIELAFNQKDKSCYQLICDSFSKPIKSLTHQPTVVYSGIREEKDHIHTLFLFNDRKCIYTHFKRMNSLTKKERDELFIVFSKYFKSSTEKQSTNELFEEEFQGDKKFIELFYDTTNNQCKGFHSYEIIQLKKHSSYLIIHGVYFALDESCRRYGVMSLISFRLAFCLQLLNATKKVLYHLSSIDYCGYRVMEKLTHFPKYQPSHMNNIMLETLNTIYENELEYIKNGLTCYLLEETQTVNPDKSNNMTLEERFFEEKLKDSNSIETKEKNHSTSIKMVPVLFPASKESLKKISTSLHRLSVDTNKHIHTYTSMFKNLFSNYSSTKQALDLPDEIDSFWQRSSTHHSISQSKL